MNAYAILGYTVVPGSLLFAGGILLGVVFTTWDTISLILASISIGIALAIFAVQQNQGGKIQGVVDQIDKTTRENADLLSDKREVYADTIINWWLMFDFSYWNTFDNYNKFIVRKEGTNEQMENTRNNIIDHYTRHLQIWRPNIAPMEIVEVYGKKYAQPWNHLIVTSSMDVNLWQPTTEEGFKLMLKHYQECYWELVEIKNMMLQYASDDIKNKVGTRIEENTKEGHPSSKDKTQKDSENS